MTGHSQIRDDVYSLCLVNWVSGLVPPLPLSVYVAETSNPTPLTIAPFQRLYAYYRLESFAAVELWEPLGKLCRETRRGRPFREQHLVLPFVWRLAQNLPCRLGHGGR